MMQTVDEQIELGRLVVATAEVLGVVISEIAAELIVQDLEAYSFLACADALKKCRQELRGKLTLSDILSRVEAQDGRPGKDEAWAIALQSHDERDTVVWTPEIAKALDAAGVILEAGDKVGARMAFNSAYERLVTAARATGQPAQWSASVGWDGDLRARAFEQAVKVERLTAPQAVAMLQNYGQGSQACADLVKALLPEGADPTLLLCGAPTGAGNAIAGLLTGKARPLHALVSDQKTRHALMTDGDAPKLPAGDVRERIQQLREDVAAHRARKLKEKEQLREAQQNDLKQRKDKTAQALAELAERNE